MIRPFLCRPMTPLCRFYVEQIDLTYWLSMEVSIMLIFNSRIQEIKI